MTDARREPAAPSSLELPPPRGILGHLRHTWSALRLLRAWRRRLSAIDQTLRETVRQRDEALADLGRTTLERAGGPASATGRLAEYAATLAALDQERTTAETEREGRAAELAAAEAERAARLAEFDAELRGIEREQAPLEAALAEHKHRGESLERHLTALRNQKRALDARAAEDADEEETDSPEDAEAERAELQSRREALDAQLEAHTTDRAALEASTHEVESQLAELTRRRSDVREARQGARETADAQVADHQKALSEITEQLEHLDGRRRAALVDLGREALQAEDAADTSPARRRARATLDEIAALRRERKTMLARRDAFDTGPMRRTLLALAALLGGLLLLIILL
ncbi:MAG: hypothetical protein KC620_08685 [Myxococcales bacterium]|nr:hypothetical protein [Myxococcales bacterium]